MVEVMLGLSALGGVCAISDEPAVGIIKARAAGRRYAERARRGLGPARGEAHIEVFDLVRKTDMV